MPYVCVCVCVRACVHACMSVHVRVHECACVRITCSEEMMKGTKSTKKHFKNKSYTHYRQGQRCESVSQHIFCTSHQLHRTDACHWARWADVLCEGGSLRNAFPPHHPASESAGCHTDLYALCATAHHWHWRSWDWGLRPLIPGHRQTAGGSPRSTAGHMIHLYTFIVI